MRLGEKPKRSNLELKVKINFEIFPFLESGGLAKYRLLINFSQILTFKTSKKKNVMYSESD